MQAERILSEEISKFNRCQKLVEQDEINRMATSRDVVERRIAAATLDSSVFLHLTDKEQATRDLLALTKDVDSDVRLEAATSLGSAFPHLIDKEQATRDLFALTKDVNSEVRLSVVLVFASTFSHLTDKEQATKVLLALVKEDEDTAVRLFAVRALGSAFPHLTDKERIWKELLVFAKEDMQGAVKLETVVTLGTTFPHLTDKEQAIKDLLALAENEDRLVRMLAIYPLSSAARHYINEKDFMKASKCFSGAASVFRYGLLKRIKIPEFYLYEGLGCYYHGRALVSELPEKDPVEYVKNIKNAVSLFDKSINYINKSESSKYKGETRFIPICLNIYSALYEYNLSYLNFDKKRFVKIKNYLDNASAQCKITGTQRGEDLVRILEKLTSSLKIRLEEIEQEKKKYDAAEKGKGGGWEAKYENHIDKLRTVFKQSLVEIDSTLNELEAPLFKKIVAIEKENLEKLQSIEPKTSWQRLYEIIKEYIEKFWKIIVAIGVILITVAEIIQNWQFISEFIKNLLK